MVSKEREELALRRAEVSRYEQELSKLATEMGTLKGQRRYARLARRRFRREVLPIEKRKIRRYRVGLGEYEREIEAHEAKVAEYEKAKAQYEAAIRQRAYEERAWKTAQKFVRKGIPPQYVAPTDPLIAQYMRDILEQTRVEAPYTPVPEKPVEPIPTAAIEAGLVPPPLEIPFEPKAYVVTKPTGEQILTRYPEAYMPPPEKPHIEKPAPPPAKPLYTITFPTMPEVERAIFGREIALIKKIPVKEKPVAIPIYHPKELVRVVPEVVEEIKREPLPFIVTGVMGGVALAALAYPKIYPPTKVAPAKFVKPKPFKYKPIKPVKPKPYKPVRISPAKAKAIVRDLRGIYEPKIPKARQIALQRMAQQKAVAEAARVARLKRLEMARAPPFKKLPKITREWIVGQEVAKIRIAMPEKYLVKKWPKKLRVITFKAKPTPLPEARRLALERFRVKPRVVKPPFEIIKPITKPFEWMKPPKKVVYRPPEPKVPVGYRPVKVGKQIVLQKVITKPKVIPKAKLKPPKVVFREMPMAKFRQVAWQVPKAIPITRTALFAGLGLWSRQYARMHQRQRRRLMERLAVAPALAPRLKQPQKLKIAPALAQPQLVRFGYPIMAPALAVAPAVARPPVSLQALKQVFPPTPIGIPLFPFPAPRLPRGRPAPPMLKKQPKRYTPSLTAVLKGIRGTLPKKKVLTGLEIRPMPLLKRRKRRKKRRK